MLVELIEMTRASRYPHHLSYSSEVELIIQRLHEFSGLYIITLLPELSPKLA
jgi:hypothetical protein